MKPDELIEHLVTTLQQIERLEREGPREGPHGLLIRDAMGEIARAALKTAKAAWRPNENR